MPPLGPTTFSIIAKGFKNEEKEGIAIGVGAAFMDFIYIMAAYGGVSIIRALLPKSVDVFFDNNEHTIKIILTLNFQFKKGTYYKKTSSQTFANFMSCNTIILLGIKLKD